jgi:hypothetical protein
VHVGACEKVIGSRFKVQDSRLALSAKSNHYLACTESSRSVQG